MFLIPNTEVRRDDFAELCVKHANLTRVTKLIAKDPDWSSLIGTRLSLGYVKMKISGHEDMIGTAMSVVDIGQSERIDNRIAKIIGHSDIIDSVQRIEVSRGRPGK